MGCNVRQEKKIETKRRIFICKCVQSTFLLSFSGISSIVMLNKKYPFKILFFFTNGHETQFLRLIPVQAIEKYVTLDCKFYTRMKYRLILHGVHDIFYKQQ